MVSSFREMVSHQGRNAEAWTYIAPWKGSTFACGQWIFTADIIRIKALCDSALPSPLPAGQSLAFECTTIFPWLLFNAFQTGEHHSANLEYCWDSKKESPCLWRWETGRNQGINLKYVQPKAKSSPKHPAWEQTKRMTCPNKSSL